MGNSRREEYSAWRRTSRPAKLAIIMETFAIFFLSFWMYEEFQNNLYLRAYLDTLPLGGSFSIIAIGSISLLGILILGLYSRLRKTGTEHNTALSPKAPEPGRITSGFMDHHTEEHLLELIRKKNQADNLDTTGNMPIKRGDENQNSPGVK